MDTDTNPASQAGARRLSADWSAAPLSHILLLRLAAFLALAWAWSWLGAALLDAMAWPGLAAAARGDALPIVFWGLLACVMVWRLKGAPGEPAEGQGQTEPGADLLQAAQRQLAEDARAAAAWMTGWELLWQLLLLLALLYAPGLVLLVTLVYGAWRGWRGLADYWRSMLWRRAARRAPGPEPAGMQRRGAAYALARLAIAPLALAERLVLVCLMWLPRAVWLAVSHGGALGRFAWRALRDAAVVPVVWGIALAAAAGLAWVA